jgi:hypothetical protein
MLLFCAGGMNEHLARVEEKLLLERARRIGARFRNLSLPRSPVLLVPGVGGSVLEQQLHGASSPPHFFCSQNTNDFSRVWIRLSNLVPEFFDCFAWQVEL